jgi:hypothetical protein
MSQAMSQAAAGESVKIGAERATSLKTSQQQAKMASKIKFWARNDYF